MNAFALSIVEGIVGSHGSGGGTPLGAVSSPQSRIARPGGSAREFFAVLQRSLLAGGAAGQQGVSAKTPLSALSENGGLAARLCSGGDSETLARLERCPFLKDAEWLSALRQGLSDFLGRLGLSGGEGAAEEEPLADLARLLRDRAVRDTDFRSPDSGGDLDAVADIAGGIAGIFGVIASVLEGVAGVLSSGRVAFRGEGEIESGQTQDGGSIRRSDRPLELASSENDSVRPLWDTPGRTRRAEIAEFLRRLDYILHLFERQGGIPRRVERHGPRQPVADPASSAPQIVDEPRVLPTGGGWLFAPGSPDLARIRAQGDALFARTEGAAKGTAPIGQIEVPDRIYYASKTVLEGASPSSPQSVSETGFKAVSNPVAAILAGTSAGEGMRSLDAGRVRLLSLPGATGEDPVTALQSLVESVRGWRQRQAMETHGERPAGDDGGSAWTRLGGIETHALLRNARYEAHGLAQPARVEPSALIDSVRQVQAVISDMAERMRGEVSLDSRNLSAVIHLDPPALGRLHIRLAVDDGQGVSAQFDSDRSETMDFLRQNQDELRRELARQGFEEKRVRLDFADDEGFAHSLGRSTAIA